ncbi:MAG: class I tRNA ligase family protein, partial [Candidatus Acidiferrales bacterium]
MLRFYNTLSGKLEEFQPLEAGRVRMYTCGPTVYDYAHIGNFRTFVFQDILRRTLRLRGFEFTHVMNITDVDDKIIRKANDAGVSIQEIACKYEEALFADSDLLSLERPGKVV